MSMKVTFYNDDIIELQTCQTLNVKNIKQKLLGTQQIIFKIVVVSGLISD